MSVAGEGGLPRVTVTLLFTDVERHTELWELDPDAMAVALAGHEQLLADAVRAAAGRVVKTEGDALMAVFDDPKAAVDAARSAQRVLCETTWPVVGELRVRMGVHTGLAYQRADDYFGPDVIRAARLCDAAHGQQVVASAVVAAIVPSEWVDLGEYSLRGLGEPERIHQLVGAGLPRDFPPLRGAAPTRDRLPRPRTSFVGRGQEIAATVSALEQHRVVTLTGVGGCGKTRLAIEATRAALSESPDGADFVDLSVVTDERNVYAAVAAALGLRTDGRTGSPEERIRSYLARRKVVVVLDNCEHLLERAAGLVDDLMQHCDAVRIVATSREPLRVEDEQIIAVGSLDIAHDAVELFRDRAVGPVSDTEAVAHICERLDGIPLAIELAAARTSHLSLADLAERLDDRFLLLTGGRRRVQRQQTLHATLDWSHDLLSDDQRTLLRRLAVFAGPFRLEAVEGICGGDVNVVDTLGALVERSMVNHHAAQRRYRLLETVRLYAEQKLLDAGETAEMRRRHRDWFQGYLGGLPLEETFFPCATSRGLVEELDDLHAAVKWSIDRMEWEIAGEMVTRLALPTTMADSRAVEIWAWDIVPRLERGSDLAFHLFLAGFWNAAGGRGREPTARGASYRWPPSSQGVGAAPNLGRAAERRSDDVSVFARAFAAFLCDAFGLATKDDALVTRGRELAATAVAMAAARAPSAWTGYAYAYAAMIALTHEDVEAAAALVTSALESDVEMVGAAYEPLYAFVRYLLNDPKAIELAARAAGRADTPTALGMSVCVVALELAREGDTTAARQELAAVLPELRHSVRTIKGTLLIGAAGVALHDEDYRRAARWLGSAAGDGGIFATPDGVMLYRRFVAAVRAALPPDEARALRDEGRATPLDAAIDELVEWCA